MLALSHALYISFYIGIALGVSRTVYSYDDDTEVHDCIALPVMDNADITAIACLPPSLVATAATNGDIVIRSLLNGNFVWGL